MRLLRPSPEEQKEQVQNVFLNKPVQEGDTWYIVSKKWYEEWENYVSSNEPGREGSAPGPIDNSSLVDSSDDSLLPQCAEGRY